MAMADESDRKVAGHCPMGCGRTLFLDDGGHIICLSQHCPRSTAVDELLAAAPSARSVAVRRAWASVPRAERTARTKAARAAYRRKLEAQVDPAGTLTPDERERHVADFLRAHMADMNARRWSTDARDNAVVSVTTS